MNKRLFVTNFWERLKKPVCHLVQSPEDSHLLTYLNNVLKTCSTRVIDLINLDILLWGSTSKKTWNREMNSLESWYKITITILKIVKKTILRCTYISIINSLWSGKYPTFVMLNHVFPYRINHFWVSTNFPCVSLSLSLSISVIKPNTDADNICTHNLTCVSP